MAIITVKGAQVDTNKYYMVKTIDHYVHCPVAFNPDGTYFEIGNLNPMPIERIEEVKVCIGDRVDDVILHCSVKTMNRQIEDLGIHGYNDLIIFRITVVIMRQGLSVDGFEDDFNIPPAALEDGKAGIHAHLKAELKEMVINRHLIGRDDDYALTLDINTGALNHFMHNVAQ